MSDSPVNALSKLVAPANGDNAILTMALLLEFAEPAPEQTIVNFSMMAAQFYHWGYLGQTMHSQTITLGALPGAPAPDAAAAMQQLKIAGHTFQPRPNLPRNRLFRDVTLRENQLLLTTDKYTRWHHVWSEAEQLLKTVLPTLKGTMKLTAATLEYVDQFRLREPQQLFPVAAVMRESDWIAGNALRAPGPWHSTHGYFAGASGSGFDRRLDNINITLSPASTTELGPQSLTIVSQHRYTEPRFDVEGAGVPTALKTVFDVAHLENKKLLEEMLTDEARQLIALNKD